MKDDYINSYKYDSWKLKKEFNPIDSPAAYMDLRIYQRYTQNGYFEKINTALRSGYTDDIAVQWDISELDKIFKVLPKQILPKNDMLVYRGASLDDELDKILQGKSGTDIYTDKAFVSTSKSKQVAKQFAQGENKIILCITIPKGSKVLDDSKLPSYGHSKMSNEEEVLLPRNAQFKIVNYNPKTRIVDAVYLGSKSNSELPKLLEYSGRDIISDLNKNLIINKKNSY